MGYFENVQCIECGSILNKGYWTCHRCGHNNRVQKLYYESEQEKEKNRIGKISSVHNKLLELASIRLGYKSHSNFLEHTDKIVAKCKMFIKIIKIFHLVLFICNLMFISFIWLGFIITIILTISYISFNSFLIFYFWDNNDYSDSYTIMYNRRKSRFEFLDLYFLKSLRDFEKEYSKLATLNNRGELTEEMSKINLSTKKLPKSLVGIRGSYL